MSTPRFVIYANDPWGLNYYSPQNNTANTADGTYEGSALLTQEAVTGALETTTAMLVESPFTHIIMGFFAIANNDPNSPWYNANDLVFTWNGVPLTETNTPSTWKDPNQPWGIAPNVADYLKQIAASGKSLIASMQQDADLITIKNWGADNFYQAFSEQVLQPFGFSGLDLDMETSWSEYGDVLIDLSNTFGQNGCLVTHAPYGMLDCDAPFSMLSYYLCSENGQPSTPIVGNTVIQSGGQNVNSISWLNIQYYSGGDQGSATETVQQYVLAANTAGSLNAGIAAPNYFCVAGFAMVIVDPQYELWNQFMTEDQRNNTPNGTIQCDPCNYTSNVYIQDTLNGLVQQYGRDENGMAQFGGVFIYSYRYYTSTQAGYSYQMSAWNSIAQTLGLIS